jgi:hypothetical protein
MADKKRSAFTIKSTIVDSDYATLANAGTDYRTLFSTIWAYIRSKFAPDSSSVSTGNSLNIPANSELQTIVIKNASGTPTVSVVSSLGNTLLDHTFTGSGTEVFKPSEFFESAGTITFTISSGSVTVWLKYL